MQPLFLLLQRRGQNAERFFKLFLLTGFHHDDGDSIYLSVRTLHGEKVLNPMIHLVSGGQRGAEFEVQNGLSAGQYTLEKWINGFRNLAENFMDSFPQVRLRRYAIHLRESAVNGQIPQVRIQDTESQGGTAEVGID